MKYYLVYACECCMRDPQARFYEAVEAAIRVEKGAYFQVTSPRGSIRIFHGGNQLPVEGTFLAEVIKGQVVFTEEGSFCDRHDDCFHDRALGRACFGAREVS